MINPQCILVTGGAGYIGSHTVVQLLEAGNQIVILDNFCNGNTKAVTRIEQITGKRPGLVVGDIPDRSILRGLFANQVIDAVNRPQNNIHPGALKLRSQRGCYEREAIRG